METASSLSTAPTVTPSDSASQVANSSGPPKSKAPKPKRPSKGAFDKDAPPGAVQVPSGKVAPGPGSKVISATIPLSGWGNLDLAPFRRDIEPTFTVDARPYADMVDTCYQTVQARYSGGGKHIPRSLFRYYCFVMWWYRAIWLHKSNGNALNSEQKSFLSILAQMEDLQLPTHVAQYLASMGNFLQGGEQYLFRLDKHEFVDDEEADVKKGWLKTSDPGNRVLDADFWTYSQVPVPAVLATTICNEADFSVGGPGDINLDRHSPSAPDGCSTVPTENIIGWDVGPLSPAHSSWRSTFSQLGWTANSLAPDVQTSFVVSTSTLKWVSERLSTLSGYKVNSIKQLVLSTQGHSMQAYYLGTDVPASQKSQFSTHPGKLCGSRYSELAVLSRFAIDVKVLAPAFSFGYRIKRSLIFQKYSRGEPQFYHRSNYQPWVILRDSDQALRDLTVAQMAKMDAPFEFGSQSFINVPRFSTHELNRSTGLTAALVLSDTK